MLTTSPIGKRAARAGPQTKRHVLDRWGAWLLLLLAAATRLPLAGNCLGEADCARYLVGMLQWLRHGPGSHFIYGKIFSPGYYAAAVWGVRHSGLSAQSLLVGVSVAAAILTAPLLYWIGRHFCTPLVAMAGAVLFLLAPGVWWLGLEAHPASLALMLVLAAVALWLRGLNVAPAQPWASRWPWVLGTTVFLTLALLAKVDFILLALIFPALAMQAPLRDRRWRVLEGFGVAVVALLAFFALRPELVGMSGAVANVQTSSAVRSFVVLPHGKEAIKQLLPLIGYGLGTLALLAAGAVLGLGRRNVAMREWRARWGWVLAAWVLPGTAVWLLIRGNNARHMAPLLIFPLWAVLEAAGSLPLRRRALGLGFALVIAANVFLIPPSSNVTLFPSGNVFAASRDLATRQRQMDAWMRTTQAGDGGECYLGNYTLPYLEYALLRPDAGAYLRLGAAGPQLGSDQWIEVNSSAQYGSAAAECRKSGNSPRSLEYTTTGLHERFLGEEWRSLPLAHRWFPGGTVKLPPAETRPAQLP